MTAHTVLQTPRFKRYVKDFQRHHYPDFNERLRDAGRVLAIDPHNRKREHNMRRLENVPKGAGSMRLRLGDWRFFYDIYGKTVVLIACDLRDDRTYRR